MKEQDIPGGYQHWKTVWHTEQFGFIFKAVEKQSNLKEKSEIIQFTYRRLLTDSVEDELEGHEIKVKKLMQFHRYNRVNHSNVRVAYFLTPYYIWYKFMAWENINCAYKMGHF